MSKYPPFDRVTASKLVAGDNILIRERQSDQPIGIRPENRFAPGIWSVEDILVTIDRSHRRAQRWYTLQLRASDSQERRPVTAAPPQRFNRITK